MQIVVVYIVGICEAIQQIKLLPTIFRYIYMRGMF